MDLTIKGLRVLVTAGANGIGRATARAFAAEGARVHICDVDEKALAEMAQSDPAITRSVCDVSDRKAVARLFEEALAALGGLDCLVNNAGIAGPTGRVDEIAPEDWDSCVAIDLTGQFNCTRLAVEHLKQSQNASIVNLLEPGREAWFSAAFALCGGEMGRDRLHQGALGRARRVRHPRQCDLPGPCRRAAHSERDRQQGALDERLA